MRPSTGLKTEPQPPSREEWRGIVQWAVGALWLFLLAWAFHYLAR